jgi:hypothetical protein
MGPTVKSTVYTVIGGTIENCRELALRVGELWKIVENWHWDHLSYASLPHPDRRCKSLYAWWPFILLDHYRESIALCCTLSHNFTLFCLILSTVDAYTHSGSI